MASPETAIARLSKQEADQLLWVDDSARAMGYHVMGGPGAGKSRLQGRVTAWGDFVRRVPQLVMDPYGVTIDNFLDKVSRLPQDKQERCYERIRYVNMSGQDGYV